MRISAAYGPGRFGLSFGLFPPKTPQGVINLFQHVARLLSFSRASSLAPMAPAAPAKKRPWKLSRASTASFDYRWPRI